MESTKCKNMLAGRPPPNSDGLQPNSDGLPLIAMARWPPTYIYIYTYLRKEETKASLWLRGCYQGRPGQGLGAQEDEVDIAATLIGGRNGK